MMDIKILKNKIISICNAGGIHIIAGNFVNKFVVFFGSICIVRLLSKYDYGVLSYVENLYNFAYIIAGFGVSNAVIRYVVLDERIEQKKATFSFMVKTAFVYNLILVAVYFFINSFYPHNNEFKDAPLLLYLMILMLPVQYFNDNNLTLKRAMFDNKKFAYFNLGYGITVIAGKCLGALSESLVYLVIIGIAIQIVFAIIVHISNHKSYFFVVKNHVSVEKKKKKEIIIYSIQYMITNGIWSLFLLMDIFLLGKYINEPIILADYKVAYAWPANLSIICAAIGMFITPYFIKNENDISWIRRNFIKVFFVNLVAVIWIALIMYIAAKPLVFIYAGEEYYNIIPLMKMILVGSVINNGCRYMIANCLAAMGKIRANMIVSFLGIVLQFGINMNFIPKFGIYGPAYTGIIVYLFMTIVLFIVFNKRYSIFCTKKGR